MAESSVSAPVYASLGENESLLLDKDEIESGLGTSPRRECQCQHTARRWNYFHLLIFAVYTAILFGLTSVYTNRYNKYYSPLCKDGQDGTVSPIMQAAFRYDRKVVDYNFESHTAFKGPPVEEVDAAWKRLLDGGHDLRLSAEQVRAANITTIQLSDGSGDYIAQPQAYHILHCVFNLYKYAHPEFYGQDPQGPAWVIEHSDHCIDTLRQFVMCHAGGSGVSTYKWLPDHKLPWPVLEADESCIDWEFFDSWVQERSIPVSDIVHQKAKHLFEHPTFGVLSFEDFRPHIS